MDSLHDECIFHLVWAATAGDAFGPKVDLKTVAGYVRSASPVDNEIQGLSSTTTERMRSDKV